MPDITNSLDYLSFEQPIFELESKIRELKRLSQEGPEYTALSDEIERLSSKREKLKKSIYSSLTSWQISQMSRHPQRPYMLDYVQQLFDGFEELHGDRGYADDRAIIAGIAKFNHYRVALVGHQKGRSTAEKVEHNFGMARPEGYRKAKRLFKLAEKFQLPVLTFIDTPGAYPGVDAEERNQSNAIAENLRTLAGLKTPIISTVTGEGGSGGALAIAVCDRLLMLQYSTYSVISPEGCASILWKDATKMSTAAEAMCTTSEQLSKLGLIDRVIEEPLGGAHNDFPALCEALKRIIGDELQVLSQLKPEELLQQRHDRLVNFGATDFWSDG